MSVGYGTTLELFESYNVTLDAYGNGTIAYIGPVMTMERWQIQVVQTTCTSGKQTKMLMTRGDRANAIIDGTYSGNQDTSPVSMTLITGQSLTFIYSGGDAGAIGTVTLQGSRELKGRLAY